MSIQRFVVRDGSKTLDVTKAAKHIEITIRGSEPSHLVITPKAARKLADCLNYTASAAEGASKKRG